MQVAEDPDLTFIFLFDLLHQILNAAYFRVVLWLGIDPLTVEIDTGRRIPIITADHTVWIHTRNKYERVEAAQILGFA